MAAVDQLMAEVGWAYDVAPVHDWGLLEQRLEVVFPDDYKYFLSKFPSGFFHEFLVYRNPIESDDTFNAFIWEFSDEVDRLRGWRDFEAGRVPYPVHPDRGSILPWAEGTEGETFFWVPGDAGRPGGSVVFCNDDYGTWGEFSGSISEFLLAFARGEVSIDFMDFEVLPVGRSFKPSGEQFE
ncbi:SMI1/KNR4 family protein [Crossiella sp. CA198]|uniref:SMI1/KNR4 family protein n=1 Tax=Crossiella sp. CA198 TaxID=3455607 RepID=UPI003F8D6C7B